VVVICKCGCYLLSGLCPVLNQWILLLFKKEYKKNKIIKVARNTYLWNRLNHVHLMLRKMCRIVKNTRMFCLWCRLHLIREQKRQSWLSENKKENTQKHAGPRPRFWFELQHGQAFTCPAIGFLTGQNSCFSCPRRFS
jgi:hypothetical protein